MPKVKYVGPYDEVAVPSLDLVVKQGETIEVPDEAAEGLLSQDIWREAVTTKGADK